MPARRIEIPEPADLCEVRLDDGSVSTVRRHGNPDGVRLVLSHGNGLASDLYAPFWSRLTDDFDVIVYDLRNHGWNRVGPLEHHNVPTLIADARAILRAVDRAFGRRPRVGVFHSISALIALLSSSRVLPAVAGLPPPFRAQVLFDPPLYKPGADPAAFDAVARLAARRIRRRQPRFQTREEFLEILDLIPTFRRVAPPVRELMARTTLRRSPDDAGYELRCPREYESRIADYVRGFAPLVDFDNSLRCPTRVLGADPTLPFAFLPAVSLGDVVTVDYDFLPGCSHLLQLEEPEACADVVRAFVAERGLG